MLLGVSNTTWISWSGGGMGARAKNKNPSHTCTPTRTQMQKRERRTRRDHVRRTRHSLSQVSRKAHTQTLIVPPSVSASVAHSKPHCTPKGSAISPFISPPHRHSSSRGKSECRAHAVAHTHTAAHSRHTCPPMKQQHVPPRHPQHRTRTSIYGSRSRAHGLEHLFVFPSSFFRTVSFLLLPFFSSPHMIAARYSISQRNKNDMYTHTHAHTQPHRESERWSNEKGRRSFKKQSHTNKNSC